MWPAALAARFSNWRLRSSIGSQFTCVDLDPAALICLDRLAMPVLRTSIRNDPIQRAQTVDHETAQTEFGRQDIVYSIGFFDYLLMIPRQAVGLLVSAAQSGGKLLRPSRMRAVTAQSFITGLLTGWFFTAH